MKWFWIIAGLGVAAYLWSKREVRATVTAGEPTISYKGSESIWTVDVAGTQRSWTDISFD